MVKTKGKLIAVCADGPWPKCSIHPKFGRCDFFHFILLGKKGLKLSESMENPFKESPSAGILAASFIAGKGAKIVVAGQFGMDASGAFSKWGFELAEADGAAKKALERIRAKA